MKTKVAENRISEKYFNLRTSIPKKIRELLGLTKGDELEWKANTDNKSVTIIKSND